MYMTFRNPTRARFCGVPDFAAQLQVKTESWCEDKDKYRDDKKKNRDDKDKYSDHKDKSYKESSL